VNKRTIGLILLAILLLGVGAIAYSRSKNNQSLSNNGNLTPVPSVNISPLPTGLAEPSPTGNIMSTLTDIGAFRYLVAAIKISNSNSRLAGNGPFTVFAPPDDAVDKLLDNPQVLGNDLNKLNSVVQYHIVQGRITSADLLKSPTLKTLNGQDIHVRVSGNSVTVENANIIDVDIPATNGIIHVIDSVMIPPK
jgi:uncharacterized surface protein with fasciclin (FAS1) repeats